MSRSPVTLSDVDALSEISRPSGSPGPYGARHMAHSSDCSPQDSWASYNSAVSYISGEHYRKWNLAKRTTTEKIKLHMITVDLFPEDDLPLFCKTIDDFWHQATANEPSLNGTYLEQDMQDVCDYLLCMLMTIQ